MKNKLFDTGQNASGSRYCYTDALELTINVAMATGRPLLLRGAPGSGKTTLASDLARRLGRRQETYVVTSRTRAQDLLWTSDAVRRLADAHGDEASRKRAASAEPYILRGVFWRAFQRDEAAVGAGAPNDVVVLLDEIDKADPDVPNDLLMLIDQGWFGVTDLPDDTRVTLSSQVKLLVVITTNGERELPEPFLRRCVIHELPDPDGAQLRVIARTHFTDLDDALFEAVHGLYGALGARAEALKLRKPSTAELLDCLRACRELGVTPASEAWAATCRAALWKHPSPPSKPMSP